MADPATEKAIIEAVSKSGTQLRAVHPSLQTSRICMAAIKNDALAIQFVSPHLISSDICMAAIVGDASLLITRQSSFPTKFLDEQFFVTALEKNWRIYEYIHRVRITPAINRAAVLSNPELIRSVPSENRTEELWLEAVSRRGKLVRYLKSEGTFRSRHRIRLTAAANDGDILSVLPDEMQTSDIIHAAISQTGIALRFVSDKKHTLPLCMMAVRKNASAIVHCRAGLGKIVQKIFIAEKLAALAALNLPATFLATIGMELDITMFDMIYMIKNITLEYSPGTNVPGEFMGVPMPTEVCNGMKKILKETLTDPITLIKMMGITNAIVAAARGQ